METLEKTFTPAEILAVVEKSFGPLLCSLSFHASVGGGKPAAANFAHAIGVKARILKELGISADSRSASR
jgi:hypothetical protein